MENKALEMPFVDNPDATEVFATAASGFFITPGNIHITFDALRVNHATSPGPMNRVVMARLGMPIQGAQGIALGL